MCRLTGMSHFKNDLRYKDFMNTVIDKKEKYGACFCFDNSYTMAITSLNNPIMMNTIDYQAMCTGRIDNQDEVIAYLEEKGITTNDKTFLIDLYRTMGPEGLSILEGVFAIAILDGEKVFLAVDHLGCNSLFYTIQNGDIYFSSDLGQLVKYTDIHEVTKQGIFEMLGMGPAHSRGKTVFKDCYRLEGGEYLIFDGSLKKGCYYELKPKENDLTYAEAKKKIKDILEDSYQKMKSGDGCLLSGGLDSSIVLSMMGEGQKTYTINYLQKEFTADKFMVSDDNRYAKFMIEKFKADDNYISISVDELIDNLEKAVDLRGYPGMADIDSSLYTFLSKIDNQILYSGECSDEVFSGYPWCYRDDGDSELFPWLRNMKNRMDLVNPKYREEMYEYVKNEYESGIKASNSTDKKQQINYLNLKYFLPNLLERQEKMSLGAKKDVRCPFASYKLVELLYNLPFDYKYQDGVEKVILREIYQDSLPKEIIERKKSPYPKISNPEYEEKIKQKLIEKLDDSILQEIIDCNKIFDLNFSLPWYGQLMSKAQFYGYLYQIDYFGREYNIKIVEE